jgi:hypothetical protein
MARLSQVKWGFKPLLGQPPWTSANLYDVAESTSQAEYAGSIPVIGSTEPLVSGAQGLPRRVGRAIDRGLTMAMRDTAPRSFASAMASR